jgi:hypothetical protein
MVHRNRVRTYLGRARPGAGLAFLVACTLAILAFVAMEDGQALALRSPLSPLDSPVSPAPKPSRAKDSLTPTVRTSEPTPAKPAQPKETQAEAAQAVPVPTEVKQGPAWLSFFGVGLISLGLALVIGGVFWLVRRQ